jgi:hypothetical protein
MPFTPPANTIGHAGQILLHGTKPQFLPIILREGLKPSLPIFGERAIYLTRGLPQARANTDGSRCSLVFHATERCEMSRPASRLSAGLPTRVNRSFIHQIGTILTPALP